MHALLADLAPDAIEGGWRGLHRDQIEGSGYVVRSLQAAVWAVSRSTNFRSAILLAANLGDDADTTAAIAGQLAGAIYGAAAIPQDWLAALAWRERLAETAGRLFDAGWAEQVASAASEPPMLGEPFSASWMTRDWTLRERLAALAAFRPVFEQDGFRFAELTPAERDGELIVLGGHDYDEAARRFIEVAYHYGWVRVLPWSEWRETERARHLMMDTDGLAGADEDDLALVLTTCIRADRFCDGYLAEAFEAGLISRAVACAERLLLAMPEGF